jgi:uncharacterized membrane protein YccC
MTSELQATTAAARALRSATRVDRTVISARTGAIAAAPVAAMFALGIAVGRPAAAVTMAVGAMLAGVAWRAGGEDSHPLATMVAAAVGLAAATVCGTISGRWPWLHLGVLVAFCAAAGLLSALGRRGNVVGTQSVIAFVVFGRFPGDAAQAFTLAGLVALGAAAQIGCAALVALPPTWRAQRQAVADAYRRLSELAAAPGSSALAAGAALEAAEQRLSRPAVLADPAVVALANLVQEGWRIRLSLSVLGAAAGDGAAERAVRPLPAALERIATAVLDPSGIIAEPPERPTPTESASSDADAADPRIETLLAGLRGQIAAARRLAERSQGRDGARRRARPTRGSRSPLAGTGTDLRRIRASATLDSAAGRHAVRLAAVVAGTELLVQRVGLPRGYWAVVAAATVLRPEFSATITRAAERLGGTLAGVVIATLIAVALHPGGWAIVAIVGVLAWATFALFPASFAAGVAGLTAMVVFLLHAVAPDSTAIAWDRGLDTMIGGAIGIAVYLLWPTWSGTSVGRLLAEVVDADRRYLDAILASLIEGVPVADERVRPLARRSRQAYSDADAAVTLTQDEPIRGIDPGTAASLLAGLRRLVLAVHALRIVSRARAGAEPLPSLAPLARSFDTALGGLAEALRTDARTTAESPLRTELHEALETLDGPTRSIVQAPLDELVDATNSAIVGPGPGSL